MCTSSNSKRTRRPPDPEACPGSPDNAIDAHSHATDITFEMLPIPGGTFEMGSPPGQESLAKDEDPLIQVSPGPQHPVRIAPFWMGKYEVTWEEYDQFAFSLDLKKKQREHVDP